LDEAFNMGIGFLEAGSVTPKPQYGNPRPRLFRDVQSRSVINRMGMSNEGCAAFAMRYKGFRREGKNNDEIVGINIAKNKDTQDPASDYLVLIDKFAPTADYLTVNISSPNTPGLRKLQGREILLPLISALVKRRDDACSKITRKTPLLIKLAPDLEDAECEDIAGILLECGVDGLVLTNTTTDRPESLPKAFRDEAGGLSGPFVRNKSTAIIRKFYQLTNGKLPIIGAGGVASGIDAYEKIRAGACLVQLYSALVFEGPGLIKRIKHDLSALLARDGFNSVAAAIGVDAQ
jgi:dihydroorotate dehydrogenase